MYGFHRLVVYLRYGCSCQPVQGPVDCGVPKCSRAVPRLGRPSSSPPSAHLHSRNVPRYHLRCHLGILATHILTLNFFCRSTISSAAKGLCCYGRFSRRNIPIFNGFQCISSHQDVIAFRPSSLLIYCMPPFSKKVMQKAKLWILTRSWFPSPSELIEQMPLPPKARDSYYINSYAHSLAGGGWQFVARSLASAIAI